MKVISRSQRKQQPQHQADAEKLNNIISIIFKKAGFTVCLFLSLSVAHAQQQWTFDERTTAAYQMVLDLRIDEALKAIPEPKKAQEVYIVGLAEAVELLITENGEKFSDYEDQFENRIETKWKGDDADHLFLQAELRLQWAFVYLKFGHEFDAALNLKHAYEIAEECKKKYPKYQSIKKTSGLLQIIIGSVPEKYNWVLGLLGIEGSVQTGLAELESIRTTEGPLQFEANILYALVQGFILQQTQGAADELRKVQQQHPSNKIALFLGASLAIKNSQSEDALGMLKHLHVIEPGLRLYYADYLRGEVYLHKGDYLNSLTAYRWFIDHYDGKNYIKDAHYKIGLCYWLNGNTNDADEMFEEARNKGLEESEADKYAARSLADPELPNVKLTKGRYFTDGGYYEQAKGVLSSIVPADIPTKRDQVEYHYRRARLAHKMNDLDAAKTFYQQAIDLAQDASWYFAPNACLQMGYIFVGENNIEKAREYFNKSMDYKKHEYKNSIDSKAKSALAQLRRK
jgi:tetratricopeptide (TPR) repeat protein